MEIAFSLKKMTGLCTWSVAQCLLQGLALWFAVSWRKNIQIHSEFLPISNFQNTPDTHRIYSGANNFPAVRHFSPRSVRWRGCSPVSLTTSCALQCTKDQISDSNFWVIPLTFDVLWAEIPGEPGWEDGKCVRGGIYTGRSSTKSLLMNANWRTPKVLARLFRVFTEHTGYGRPFEPSHADVTHSSHTPSRPTTINTTKLVAGPDTWLIDWAAIEILFRSKVHMIHSFSTHNYSTQAHNFDVTVLNKNAGKNCA